MPLFVFITSSFVFSTAVLTALTLHYNEYGSPDLPPLLILHGFLGASGNWHTLSRNVFSQSHHVFAVDLRNHGESPHADLFSVPAMVSDVVELLRVHNLKPIDIVGHSMGGKVAMELALSHPDLVRKLVVVDIAPGQGNGGHETILNALQAIDLSQPTSRSAIDAALAQSIPDMGVRQFLLKNLQLVGEGLYRWKNNLDVLASSYPEINEPVSAGTYEGPTLFVKGGRSRYIQQSDWAGIVGRFPAAELAVLEDAGHWVHAEDPDGFARVVNEFLESNVQSTST